MSFVKGDIGEDLWCDYIKKRGHTDIIRAPKMKFYDWDVKSIYKKEELTFEVKYDSKAYMWAARRGTPEHPNLYIEFRSTTRDCDSGILKSKAYFYFYILKTGKKDIAFVFDRVQLLQHLQMANYRVVGNSATGDDNAEGWIPPLHELLVSRYGYKATIDLTEYA